MSPIQVSAQMPSAVAEAILTYKDPAQRFPIYIDRILSIVGNEHALNKAEDPK